MQTTLEKCSMQNIPKVPDGNRLNSFLVERECSNLQQETVNLATIKDKKNARTLVRNFDVPGMRNVRCLISFSLK